MGQIKKIRRAEAEAQARAMPGEYVPGMLRPNPQPSSYRRFRMPVTLTSDWANNLLEDKPHVNYTYELLPVWHEQFEEGYLPYLFRGQQTPIDWKSKIGNSDANFNLKTTHLVPMKKGDMVRREDGVISLINWEIQEHANNRATQVAKCNLSLTIRRDVPEEVDRNGYLIQEAGVKVIVDAQPSITSEYAGRPDFTAYTEVPGVTPDHLITVSTQWNDRTKEVLIGDEFEYGKFTYRVVNISLAEVEIDQSAGVLALHARRVAGGELIER